MTAFDFKPDMAPPVNTKGAIGWMRANLFSSWYNTLLSLFAVYVVWLVVPPLLDWAVVNANWRGTTRADCTNTGACWVFVQQRFDQFMYGYYPDTQRWRVNLTVIAALIGALPFFVRGFPRKAVYGVIFLGLFPVLAFTLLHGGYVGLDQVPTSKWGGLMLTLVIATVGIAGALPLGIILALGRRSNMPAIKVFVLPLSSFGVVFR